MLPFRDISSHIDALFDRVTGLILFLKVVKSTDYTA